MTTCIHSSRSCLPPFIHDCTYIPSFKSKDFSFTCIIHVWTVFCTDEDTKCIIHVHVYMLGTDLKPAACFKAVQTFLTPSGQFRSRPEGLI